MTDIEKILQQGNAIRIKPKGYSMYPMLIPHRDEVIIEPVENSSLLKRGDVVLYRRDESILVLHRIWKVKPDGFYLVGDNQEEIEGPVRADRIKGKLIYFIRNNKQISVGNIVYRFVSGCWLFVRPFRKYIKRPVAFIKKRMR